MAARCAMTIFCGSSIGSIPRTTGKVVGYTVARPNQRTFDFDSALPEPAVIVRGIQALDSPAAPAPVLAFRSAADQSAEVPA
jgi:hypothetical protein